MMAKLVNFDCIESADSFQKMHNEINIDEILTLMPKNSHLQMICCILVLCTMGLE